MAGRKVWSALLAFGLVTGCGVETAGPAGLRMAGVLAVSGWTGTLPTGAGDGIAELRWDRQPGSADLSAPQILVAPDTVQAGRAFEVTTNTVGMNGCWRAGGQNVQIEDRTVLIAPYDAHSGAEVCTEILLFLSHRSTLVLEEPGTWTLRVSGRRVRLGDDVRYEPITAEKTIVVQ